MTELEKARKSLILAEHAVFNVRFAAEEERKLTHSKNIVQNYVEALDRLEVKLVGARAYFNRIETIGQ